MGKLTQAQIISHGMTLAGKTSTALASIVAISFNAWLRSTHKGWLWPWLNQQAQGLTLAQGATSMVIGGGIGGVTQDIAEVFDPVYWYTSDYRSRGRGRIRNIRGNSAETETSILDPALNRGPPEMIKVRQSATVEGQVTLVPWPIPDRAYLLTLDLKILPANIVDADVPRYPNDRTLIQAAKVFTLEHMGGSDGNQKGELDLLAAMVAQDFGKDGSITGTNDALSLNSSTFR